MLLLLLLSNQYLHLIQQNGIIRKLGHLFANDYRDSWISGIIIIPLTIRKMMHFSEVPALMWRALS